MLWHIDLSLYSAVFYYLSSLFFCAKLINIVCFKTSGFDLII